MTASGDSDVEPTRATCRRSPDGEMLLLSTADRGGGRSASGNRPTRRPRAFAASGSGVRTNGAVLCSVTSSDRGVGDGSGAMSSSDSGDTTSPPPEEVASSSDSGTVGSGEDVDDPDASSGPVDAALPVASPVGALEPFVDGDTDAEPSDGGVLPAGPGVESPLHPTRVRLRAAPSSATRSSAALA